MVEAPFPRKFDHDMCNGFEILFIFCNFFGGKAVDIFPFIRRQITFCGTEAALPIYILLKKKMPLQNRSIFVHGFRMGGVSIISGTPCGVCREPFRPQNPLISLCIPIIKYTSLFVNLGKFLQSAAFAAMLQLRRCNGVQRCDKEIIVFHV